MRTTLAASRSHATRTVVTGLALLMAATLAWGLQAMPRGQRHESRREIDQLEQTWRQAVLHRDTQTMSRLLAEDFLSIAPNGLLQTKAETLAAMRTGAMVFHSIDILEQRVRFYGETAVVTSKARVMATTSGGDLMGNYRYTRVYARDRKGSWRIVSFEASRIRPRTQHH
ncbi:MAG TPA: nuclear transport factor 2 family protein [Terracidiphilus sp.]|nr:nuclear transport factor 2 family protein [Terracidiphilus sp.]